MLVGFSGQTDSQIMDLRKRYEDTHCSNNVNTEPDQVIIFVWDKKNRQPRPTFNVTLRGVRITIVAKEEQYILNYMFIFSLSNAAWKAHAPYYIVSSSLYGPIMFFHIIS
jgi:hypothetical protein